MNRIRTGGGLLNALISLGGGGLDLAAPQKNVVCVLGGVAFARV